MVIRQTTAPNLADRKQLYLRNRHIASLIHPIPKTEHGIDVQLRELHRQLEQYDNDYGLTLNPDFQRGHVWSREQQIAFIESWIRGAVGEQARTITLNCPDFAGRDKAADSDLDGMVCLDGLQRLTAVMDFIEGKFRVFTNPDVEELKDGLDYQYFNYTAYSVTTKHLRFQIYYMQKKADLLDYYLAFNGGGTPHSQEELTRIRQMREGLNSQA
ncbi:DUF262 domain-containing protein [Acinetobacter indicus]|uniref:DUF262 domain-containing protein n=1 Tax=Acinetobacter TaxID=469 RepID=UPI0015D14451|nr:MULTISPECIES: DUF262 domain-containing protein [Acinetobacter]MCP0918029.1 DUF262 domain-containing protein [Acinetobacter indicus]